MIMYKPNLFRWFVDMFITYCEKQLILRWFSRPTIFHLKDTVFEAVIVCPSSLCGNWRAEVTGRWYREKRDSVNGTILWISVSACFSNFEWGVRATTQGREEWPMKYGQIQINSDHFFFPTVFFWSLGGWETFGNAWKTLGKRGRPGEEVAGRPTLETHRGGEWQRVAGPIVFGRSLGKMLWSQGAHHQFFLVADEVNSSMLRMLKQQLSFLDVFSSCSFSAQSSNRAQLSSNSGQLYTKQLQKAAFSNSWHLKPGVAQRVTTHSDWTVVFHK